MKIVRLSHVLATLQIIHMIGDAVTEKTEYEDQFVAMARPTLETIDSNIQIEDAVDREESEEDEDPNWNIKRAIKDIAYYLRAHKFSDYDRRYYQQIQDVSSRLWAEFPKPPLRSLHWQVHSHCDISFRSCVKYLDSCVQETALRREDDTLTVMGDNKWTIDDHEEQIIAVDRECQAAKARDNLTYVPFHGPIERFQWRTSASYYMCWYTMLGQPELFAFNEPCDNFADCYTIFGRNRDPRANDEKPFACALYSFCPDPCCSEKHLWYFTDCYKSPLNPCKKSNDTDIEKCTLKRENNQNLYALIANQLNISCDCNEIGYEWSSRFGLCVDINECTNGLHNCSIEAGEMCMNLPGNFDCVCQIGFIYNMSTRQCIPNPSLNYISLQIPQVVKSIEKADSTLKYILNVLTNSSVINGQQLNLLVTIVILIINLM